MAAILRSVPRVFRGSQCASVPLSARIFKKRAHEKCTLANKVAVVTGSTKGETVIGVHLETRWRGPKPSPPSPLLPIGFAIARRLAQDGAHVVISSRKQQNVDRAVTTLKEEGLSVTGTVCHVGKAEDRQHLVATALEHSGGVDFLVCVAGVSPFLGSTLGASEQIWDKKLGIYNTSKTALLGLCKSLAVELAPKGICVNCIVPGITKTNFGLGVKVEKTMLDMLPNLNKIYGLQRLGEPEDCAGIVSFLCSSDASYITGENIIVAGFSSRLRRHSVT